MRLAWLTDIHLNFLKRSGPFHFGTFVRNNSKPDIVVISGDISESQTLQSNLVEFARGLNKPIYFVLGNHDYYDSSFEKTNQIAEELMNINSNICWLTKYGPIHIGKDTFLIGHEGWYDARCGVIDEYHHHKMTDFDIIEDFKNLSHDNLINKFRELGNTSAIQALQNLNSILYEKSCKNIIFVTHVPPFMESSYYKELTTESEYLPYYVNLSMGIMLIKFAKEHPEFNITVLCGHTHYPATFKPLFNLIVYTGAADYRKPQVNKVFEIE